MNAFQAALGRISTTLTCLAIGAAMIVTPSADAQNTSGAFAGLREPGYTSRDIQLAAQILELNEQQTSILRTLFEDYRAEFNTSREAMFTGIVDEIQGLEPDEVLVAVTATVDRWGKQSNLLAEQLMGDLQTLLSEDQTAMWPVFTRKLYRTKYLPKGQLSGERLDLQNVLRELNLDAAQTEAIQPILDRYEIALYDALKAREDAIEGSRATLMEAIRNQTDVSQSVVQRELGYRKAVRDVNEQHAQEISTALGPEVGAEFMKRMQQRTYTRIFRTTRTERIFKAAAELEGLDTDVLEAIASLEQSYTSELALFNDRLVQMTREFEPESILAKAGRRSGATPPADPVRVELGKRREMGDRYINQLKGLLTPEQFAALPGAGRFEAGGPAAGASTPGGSGGPASAGASRSGKQARKPIGAGTARDDDD